MRQDWAQRDLTVQTNKPKGSLRTSVELYIKPIGGRQITTSYLLEGANQAQQAITAGVRRVGGYLATLAAPTVHQVDVTLAGCCGGSALLDGETFRQAANGKVTIPLAALRRHPDAVLMFSSVPVALDPTN